MLIGDKVILEEIDPENIEQMRQWRNNPELRKYFREYKDITKPMQEKWYDERGNNSNPSHVYFQIMEYKHEMAKINKDVNGRVLIGCCGLHYIDWRLRSAEFGVFIGKMSSRGGGKGKEALTLLFDYGFKEMNLHKIWCEVYDSNAAFGLYRDGLGMKEDGKIRHSQFTDGEYIDSTLLSVLEDEWFERSK